MTCCVRCCFLKNTTSTTTNNAKNKHNKSLAITCTILGILLLLSMVILFVTLSLTSAHIIVITLTGAAGLPFCLLGICLLCQQHLFPQLLETTSHAPSLKQIEYQIQDLDQRLEYTLQTQKILTTHIKKNSSTQPNTSCLNKYLAQTIKEKIALEDVFMQIQQDLIKTLTLQKSLEPPTNELLKQLKREQKIRQHLEQEIIPFSNKLYKAYRKKIQLEKTVLKLSQECTEALENGSYELGITLNQRLRCLLKKNRNVATHISTLNDDLQEILRKKRMADQKIIEINEELKEFYKTKQNLDQEIHILNNELTTSFNKKQYLEKQILCLNNQLTELIEKTHEINNSLEILNNRTDHFLEKNLNNPLLLKKILTTSKPD